MCVTGVGQQTLLMDTAQAAPRSESSGLGLEGDTPSRVFATVISPNE